MSFLPENLTPAFRSLWYAHAICSRGDTSLENISHSDGHSILRCRTGWMFFRKTKRADYTEHQESAGAWLSLQNDVLCNRLWRSKSGSASYSSRQQNQRRGGAVRHFRCTDTVSDKTDLWWNIGIQLYHHYTDTSLMRQVSEYLSLYSEFQRAIFNGIRKRSLYWLGHLGAIYQRVLKKILKNLLYTSRRNFQIRTLLNIFFDPFFQGGLCHNLNVWLFISQVIAGE